MKRTRSNLNVTAQYKWPSASTPVLMEYYPNGTTVTRVTDPQWGQAELVIVEAGNRATITDETGGSKFGDRPVVHEKMEYRFLNPCPYRWPGSALDMNSGWSQAGYPCYHDAKGWCETFNAFGSLGQTSPGLSIIWPQQTIDYGDVLQKAYKPTADLLVNLIEADEIPRAVKTVSGVEVFSNFTRLWSDRSRTGKCWFRTLWADLIVKPVIRDKRLQHLERFLWESSSEVIRGYGRVISTILKTGARSIPSLHLATIFGIMPLIRDTAAVIRYADRAEKDLKKYSSATRRQVSIVQTGGIRLGSRYSDTYGLGVGSHWKHTIDSAVCLRRYHLGYIEPALSTAIGRRADLLMRRFTSGGLASTLWELAPLSFVVDWFLDMGNLLLVIDEKLGHPEIRINTATVSETIRAQVTEHNKCVWAMTGTGVQVTAYDTAWKTMSVSRYARSPMSRHFTLVKVQTRFGKSELLTSMSLLAQRLIR